MVTVLGAAGYIGSNLVNKLKDERQEVYAPKRGEELINKYLGNIIYCIGLTADFRTKPFETVEAHVCVLNKILRDCEFESLTYLSSTRLYINSKKQLAEEEEEIGINILNPDELYTLTKLTGERICLSSGRNVKIVRLSNIFGNDFNSDNFLSDLVRKIQATGSFTLNSSLSSSKDYLYIDDAVDIIIKIALNGKQNIYNVASGFNTSNQAIITALANYTDFSFSVAENARDTIFPQISVKKIEAEFNFSQKNITEYIYKLLKSK